MKIKEIKELETKDLAERIKEEVAKYNQMKLNHAITPLENPSLIKAFPLSSGIVLARDSIVGILIPCSISLPASLFTRSVTHHPVINSLVTLRI